MAVTPAQIEAAMPAMREWLRTHTTAGDAIASYTRVGIEWLIDVHYRSGGVAQFIRDQEERRG